MSSRVSARVPGVGEFLVGHGSRHESKGGGPLLEECLQGQLAVGSKPDHGPGLFLSKRFLVLEVVDPRGNDRGAR